MAAAQPSGDGATLQPIMSLCQNYGFTAWWVGRLGQRRGFDLGFVFDRATDGAVEVAERGPGKERGDNHLETPADRP